MNAFRTDINWIPTELGTNKYVPYEIIKLFAKRRITMDEITIMQIALIIATILLIIAFICYFYQTNQRKWKSLNQKLIWPGIFLLLSILCLRLIYSYGYEPIEGIGKIKTNFIIDVIHGIVLTLQTFSLDAKYDEVLYKGKQLFDNNFQYWLYGGLTAVTSLLATLVVTSFILGFLTSIFPQIRLLRKPFRKKYIFSELNEKSISLAEDIIRIAKKECKEKRPQWIPEKNEWLWIFLPTIIFTDAYIDHSSEINTELHQRANEIEAICIKDDILKTQFKNVPWWYRLMTEILHLDLSWIYPNNLHYFLIDEENISNIHAVTSLVTKKLDRYKIGCHVHVFSQNPEAISIVKKLYHDTEISDESYKKIKNIINKTQNEIKLKDLRIVIQVVQEYTSIVYDLFNEKPLYLPLLSKTKNKELVVTIIGGGKTGMEAFLGAYWYGQILNHELRINVITEDAEKFKSTIEHINPEILNSGTLLDIKTSDNDDELRIFSNIQEADKELLQITKNGKQADPYSKFLFRSIDVKTGNLYKVLDKREEKADGFFLLDSDYFIVALGSDELNISIATDIDRMVRRNSLEKEKPNMTVIAYAVYDSKTNEILNLPSTQDKSGKTIKHAFASLKKIYSKENIFMTKVEKLAFNLNREHDRANKKDYDRYLEKFHNKFLADEYNWWSSIARVYHFKYKMFSTDVITNLNEPDENVLKQYYEKIEKNKKLRHELAWLEHRRWNAFMRTKGFKNPTENQWKKYAFNDSDSTDGSANHKHIPLMLHPCIVECSKNESMVIEDKDWDIENLENLDPKYDLLDIASIKVFQMEEKRRKEKNNFKIWDNPKEDVQYIELTKKIKKE